MDDNRETPSVPVAEAPQVADVKPSSEISQPSKPNPFKRLMAAFAGLGMLANHQDAVPTQPAPASAPIEATATPGDIARFQQPLPTPDKPALIVVNNPALPASISGPLSETLKGQPPEAQQAATDVVRTNYLDNLAKAKKESDSIRTQIQATTPPLPTAPDPSK